MLILLDHNQQKDSSNMSDKAAVSNPRTADR